MSAGQHVLAWIGGLAWSIGTVFNMISGSVLGFVITSSSSSPSYCLPSSLPSSSSSSPSSSSLSSASAIPFQIRRLLQSRPKRAINGGDLGSGVQRIFRRALQKLPLFSLHLHSVRWRYRRYCTQWVRRHSRLSASTQYDDGNVYASYVFLKLLIR